MHDTEAAGLLGRGGQSAAGPTPSIDEECAIRAEPLGSDRRYNRYWLFTPSAAPSTSTSASPADDPEAAAADAGWARLWVERAPDGAWQLLTTPEQFDALAASLDPRGAREGALAAAMGRVADRVKKCMPGGPVQPPMPFEAMPAESRAALDESLASRAEAVRLLAGACLAPGDDYTADVELPATDCARTRRLKRDMLRLEAALPAEAVDEGFERIAWAEAVRSAPNPAALRTCLGQLEAALLPSPDGTAPGLLATVFHRHPPLVRGAWVEVGREVATALPGPASKEILPPLERPDGAPPPPPSDEPLAWLPPTLPAIALRLLALDAAIVYRQGSPPGREVMAGYKYTVRPAPRDAQPVVVAAAGKAGDAVPPSSSALPLGVGGGAVLLTNVLADRGRVREASRRVPELPGTIMVLRAREFTLPVEAMRSSVAEAERQGLAAVPAAATGKGKGKAAGGKGGKGGDAAGAAAPAPKSYGSRSVVVVSGRGVAAPTKNKGAVKAKGTAPPPSAARVKPSGKGSRGKGAAAAAAPAAAEEPEPEEEAAPGPGAEDDDEAAAFLSDEEEDAQEEGYDDPYDSDYR
ncbi:hypothetical protein GPECTOR_1g490 [Gonium pectorale]|uniref:WHIM2 domain-containing protein n=1 Tax=Gonium pectorale TaxID=33097 RepID=A0A150H2Z6_GONPE|nr:hypothetical protein GPECTOR_1g490 [Gonium pectorale]|eukprot:KXZ56546.1 hypothetical protein GPECTOR_1g490 [Gonium pectorale]